MFRRVLDLPGHLDMLASAMEMQARCALTIAVAFVIATLVAPPGFQPKHSTDNNLI
jgi:hypothetical protein